MAQGTLRSNFVFTNELLDTSSNAYMTLERQVADDLTMRYPPNIQAMNIRFSEGSVIVT